jgi:superfamily I DNA/RNA helicase
MTIHKVFGPPGTGKTTYLLSTVEHELDRGVLPCDIGYLAFTRKASTEARERALVKFPHLNEKTDFPYFRTLHSLAYRCLGITSKDMMAPENFREFAKMANLDITVEETGEEEGFVKVDNTILNEINLARIRGDDLHTHYNRSNLQIEWYHFEFVERTYRQYKQTRLLLDFTDLSGANPS